MAERTNDASRLALVYDDVYLAHETGDGFPERPARLEAIVRRLKDQGWWDRVARLAPEAASERWIGEVHHPAYIERARESCERGAGHLDSPDVPVSRESFRAATYAAGAGSTAADALAEGRFQTALCLVRPPGHHAMPDRAMGFCLFNNIAIAARRLQRQHGFERILIVDWDVHHGNGTEAAFYEDPAVLFFSAHQHPFYPGTGSADRTGEGDGEGFNINAPLPAGSDIRAYREAFEQRLEPAARRFKPQIVLLSAGFDAHRDDPLANMNLTAQDFGEFTRTVRGIAETHAEGRVLSFLEGGYDLAALAESLETHARHLLS